MKSIHLACVVLLCVAAFVSSDAFALFRLGADGGVSISTLTSSTGGTSYSSNTGLWGGPFFELGDNGWAIQPECDYIQKGAAPYSSLETTTLVLNYFEIPVYFKYTFDLPGR